MVNATEHDAAGRMIAETQAFPHLLREDVSAADEDQEPAPPADVPMADILPGEARTCLKTYGLGQPSSSGLESSAWLSCITWVSCIT